MQDFVLRVRNLRVGVEVDGSMVDAVRGVSFDIRAGARVGLVGESGAGKSLTGLALMRMIPESCTQSGQLLFDGRDLMGLNEEEMASMRGAEIAMVYQNPMSALNPVQTVGHQVMEAIRCHQQRDSRREAEARARDVFRLVGLGYDARRFGSYPHELSGGQRQRVVIAMAVCCEPKLLIADEPTSALDVTTQRRIVDLLLALAEERDMALLFVSHDLAVVEDICESIDVMYAGRIVESSTETDLFRHAVHPYPEALIDSICGLSADVGSPLPTVAGQPPPVGHLATGCSFHPRCLYAEDICATSRPEAVEIDSRGAFAECHFALDRAGARARAQDSGRRGDK